MGAVSRGLVPEPSFSGMSTRIFFLTAPGKHSQCLKATGDPRTVWWLVSLGLEKLDAMGWPHNISTEQHLPVIPTGTAVKLALNSALCFPSYFGLFSHASAHCFSASAPPLPTFFLDLLSLSPDHVLVCISLEIRTRAGCCVPSLPKL